MLKRLNAGSSADILSMSQEQTKQLESSCEQQLAKLRYGPPVDNDAAGPSGMPRQSIRDRGRGKKRTVFQAFH